MTDIARSDWQCDAKDAICEAKLLNVFVFPSALLMQDSRSVRLAGFYPLNAGQVKICPVFGNTDNCYFTDEWKKILTWFKFSALLLIFPAEEVASVTISLQVQCSWHIWIAGTNFNHLLVEIPVSISCVCVCVCVPLKVNHLYLSESLCLCE